MHHTKDANPYTSHVSTKTVATLILVVLFLAFCIFATWTYTHRLSPAQQAANEREQAAAAANEAQIAAKQLQTEKLTTAASQYQDALKNPSEYVSHDFAVTKISYAVIDITGDKIPEMFMRVEYEKAMSEIYIFSSLGKQGDMTVTDKPLYEGRATIGDDATGFQIGKEPNTLLQNEYPSNSQTITSTMYKLSNGKLVRKQQWTYIKNNAPEPLSADHWHLASEIQFIDANNTSLLDDMVKTRF